MKDKIQITKEGPTSSCEDYENGRCKSTGKICDMCYESSIRCFENCYGNGVLYDRKQDS